MAVEDLGWPWDGTFDEYDALQVNCEWEYYFGEANDD